jgi:hypothetical protein
LPDPMPKGFSLCFLLGFLWDQFFHLKPLTRFELVFVYSVR